MPYQQCQFIRLHLLPSSKFLQPACCMSVAGKVRTKRSMGTLFKVCWLEMRACLLVYWTHCFLLFYFGLQTELSTAPASPEFMHKQLRCISHCTWSIAESTLNSMLVVPRDKRTDAAC